MKTIEEASKEYFLGINKIQSINAGTVFVDVKKQHLENLIDDTFKAGVEFATGWISVEDELPEESNETVYLVKTNDGYSVGIYFAVWNIDTWRINLNETPVTHWRQIEIK